MSYTQILAVEDRHTIAGPFAVYAVRDGKIASSVTCIPTIEGTDRHVRTMLEWYGAASVQLTATLADVGKAIADQRRAQS
jgi:hypothetical protein